MSEKLTLIPCNDERHWEFVRALRTDPRVSDGFISEAEITPEQQREYMSKHWREYFIALLDGEPVGFVGSVDGDIRVCTHPDYQRRGIGTFMVRELIKRFPRSFAKIKAHNEASKSLFTQCGFAETFVIYEPAKALKPIREAHDCLTGDHA